MYCLYFKKMFGIFLVVSVGVFCSYEQISDELQIKIREAACESNCRDQGSKFDCNSPMTKCNCSLNMTDSGKFGNNFNLMTDKIHLEPKLLCKTQDVLFFKWKSMKRYIFIVELKLSNSTWKVSKKTMCSSASLENLKADSYYQIRIWGISSERYIFGPYYSKWTKTAVSHYKPLAVSNINVTELTLTSDRFTAQINWQSPDDQNCFYNFLWYATNAEDLLSFQEYEVRNLNDLFQINISNLEFGNNYSVSVRSVNGDFDRESDATEMYIITPTCLEVYNNLTVCEPPEPKILSIEESLSEDSDLINKTYDIKITLEKPILIPDNYSVYVIPLNSSISDVYQNIPGSQTVCDIYGVPVDVVYQVAIMASSLGGNSSYAISEKVIRWSPSWNGRNQYFTIIASVIGLITALLLVIAFLHRRYQKQKSRDIVETPALNDYGSNLGVKNFSDWSKGFKEDTFKGDTKDEWQLMDEQILLDDILGEGAFGVVRKGYLRNFDGSQEVVAIKMLKGNPSGEEIKQFEQEIEIMKSVGPHPHLVSLVGCTSKLGYFGPVLVVEFCAKGDLQSFLRAVWERLVGQSLETRYINTPSILEDTKVGNNFSNKLYILNNEPLLKPYDLLSFARQITMGMQYLSNLRVVHRDLAARNVLMTENCTVKVADFGLSRDVYQDNIYLKTGTGKLPVKWMAIESLSHQQYTTQSDIWSFGIVLWEIVTLGGNPYATISAADMLNVLKRGYRMECPKNCSQELYNIMQMCWRESPMERPNFNDLRLMLEKFLEDENRYVTLDVRY